MKSIVFTPRVVATNTPVTLHGTIGANPVPVSKVF